MSGKAFIDVDHLERYVAGDRVLRDEILEIYEQQAESWIRILDPRADDAAWRDAAHALKGASRGVGAWRIGDICEQAEQMVGEDGTEESRRQIVERLKKTVLATIGEVRQLRGH